MNQLIFIRVDANENIGMGHLMRCLTIAQELRNRGNEVVFLYSGTEKISHVSNQGFREINLGTCYTDMTQVEAEKILNIMSIYKSNKIILDSYYVTDEYIKTLKNRVKVICINSVQKFFDVDLLVNYSIIIDKKFYETTYDNNSVKLLLGSVYAPLRQEFTNIKYKVNKNVRRIIVLTGGGDRLNFVSRFLRLLKDKNIFSNINFLCIIGSYNTHEKEIKKIADEMRNIQILTSTTNIAKYMEEADLAITAGGTTLYELGSVGVPQVVFSIADDQVKESMYLSNNEAISYVGFIDSIDFWENLLNQINNMVINENIRKRFSNRMKYIVDGKGTARIVEDILLL